MKKIIGILAALIMCLSLSSCVTTAYAQVDEVYEDDFSLVITYGTPYYNAEGLLLYYIYRDMFYYPYYYNNRYYLHRYSRMAPPYRYRPVPRDFYMHPPRTHNHGVKPPHDRGNRHATPNRPPATQQRPNGVGSRPNTNGNVGRPSTPNTNRNVGRPSTPSVSRSSGSVQSRPSTSSRSSAPSRSGGGGHFGGRR